MDKAEKKQLRLTALRVRKGIIEGTYNAKSGHPGGSLSIAEILTYLYFKEMNVDPKNPSDPDRDRFVLSKGHASPLLYGALAEKGFFPKDDLKTFRQTTSHLQGHPDKKGTPGVDMTTGSLGIGISAACGMALAGKISGKTLHDGVAETLTANAFAACYATNETGVAVQNDAQSIFRKNGLPVFSLMCGPLPRAGRCSRYSSIKPRNFAMSSGVKPSERTYASTRSLLPFQRPVVSQSR